MDQLQAEGDAWWEAEPVAWQVSPLDIGLLRNARVPLFIGSRALPWRSGPRVAHLGWGRKGSGRRAVARAHIRDERFLLLEDGFLRSVEPGPWGAALSQVCDDVGIYYDATSPSRLEALVGRDLDAAQRARAGALRLAWCAGRVSKYNNLREYAGDLPARYVLVADQTAGDASIQYGQADAAAFARMLAAALSENPDCVVLVKIHPDVWEGKKRGHFELALLGRNPRIQVLAENAHPCRLLEQAVAVYVVTSQLGFEALLWGRPVRTFGMPFYAGWGLTIDELPAPARRRPAGLANLIHAALIDYPRYVDPETGARCEPERVMAHLALQRRMRERFPPLVYAIDFSPWKQPIVRDFLAGSEVAFVDRGEKVPAGATVVVWSRKPVPGALPAAVRLIRLEDGFLRSAGLGADLVRPLSWVMDERGIYFDATCPSGLEVILQTADFDGPLRSRAAALRGVLCREGLSKYNVGRGSWLRPSGVQRVILVPGQVESDLSIQYGCPGPRTNRALLEAVRRENPDAYIVYKPHPDVVAGLRERDAALPSLNDVCDEQVIQVPIASLISAVDEVHTLTSLAGFEALLRGKRVVTWGQPFYAGWGLTEDRYPVNRRTRRLALDDLVAGAMILYPVYLGRINRCYTTPEHTVRDLLAWRAAGVTERVLWRKVVAWRRALLRLFGWRG